MRAGENARVAILAAQQEEAAPLIARLGARRDGGERRARFWRAQCDAVEVTIAIGGVGRRRAAAAAAALLDRSRASCLLVIGVAGALTRDLALGEVVVGETVWNELGEALRPDPRGVAVARADGARGADVLTVDRMIATAGDRETLLRTLTAHYPAAAGRDEASPVGAAPAAADPVPVATVVDMESYDATSEAAARGVAAVVMRAVSDTAGEDLPAFLESCRRADGDIDRRRVVAHALAHPGAIPALLELRRRVRLGAGSLADRVMRVLPSLAAFAG